MCNIRGYKRRKLSELEMEEKLDIVDDIIVKKDYHENICARYNIGRESIKTLLKNLKRDPSYLRKQESKRKAKLDEKNLIIESAEAALNRNNQIGSSKEI